MNTKHTPGPWLSYPGRGEVYVAERTGEHTARLRVVAMGATAANARLIAAAPDLFSAAHETVSALDDEYKLAGHDDDWIYDVLGSGLAAAYFSVRAAIAKARGEQA